MRSGKKMMSKWPECKRRLVNSLAPFAWAGVARGAPGKRLAHWDFGGLPGLWPAGFV